MNKEIVILCSIPEINDATSFYRAAGPLGHLRRASSRPISYTIVDQISWSAIALSDVVFFQRPSTANHLKAMQIAKDMGKPIWVDYDDDLLSVPTDNPTYSIYGKVEIQSNIFQMIDLASVVSVSTQGLANNLIEKGLKKEKFVVIENAADLTFNKPMGAAEERSNLVMWRGSPSHFRDVLSVTPQLIDLINGSKNFQFEFMGDRLWFLTDRCNPEKLTFTPPMALNAYFKHIYASRPKVFIAPLVDSKFNQAKSNIAWIEATLAGAVCVSADLPEWRNSGAIRFVEGKNNFQAVLQHAMALSPAAHKEIVANSWVAIRARYNLEIQNKKRENLILELL